MKTNAHLKASAYSPLAMTWSIWLTMACFLMLHQVSAQTMLNIDFGVGKKSIKTGYAGVGQTTNDFWNLYRHYDPRYAPGMPLVKDGSLTNLLYANRMESAVSITVSNAPGVWGNPSGDPMYDTFIFAPNGSNIWVSISGLGAGNYHFYLYGHADPDGADEYNSIFTVRSGTNIFGPLAPHSSAGWKASSPWQERSQYVVFRDVAVFQDSPIVIEVAPSLNGLAVINGLQILSRGTSPLKPLKAEPEKFSETITNLIFREARFEGKVTDTEARFKVNLVVESKTTNEISAPLFEGDIAVIVPQLPKGLRVVNSARTYRLVAIEPGFYPFTLELAAKITKTEPWNQISFTAPNAAIATVTVLAGAPGVEMQLLSGTQLDTALGSASEKDASSASPENKGGANILSGHLGPDRVFSMRWQSKTDGVTRKSLVAADTQASAQATPTVIKYKTQFRFEILQAPLPRLVVGIPASQTLTQVQGEQIRDWKLLSVTNGLARLEIEFVKPVEKNYSLTVLTEQTVESTPYKAVIFPPQPLDVDRESGLFNLSADDMQVESEVSGARQINAPTGVLAAYRFFGRPFALTSTLTRIEPVIKVADRVTARMEETRLQATHALTLQVEKAGIYSVELTPPNSFVVSDVRGDGVEDWKTIDGRIKISFSSRVLGKRQLYVLLEQSLKEFPDKITLTALPLLGATNQTAQIGVVAHPGIMLKTDELNGLREIPIASLPGRSDESLAFVADIASWSLKLASEKLSPRVVAEIFNLVAIGDGLVGGSATVRYAIVNQGVQEFRVQLPALWRNVEFTGPNIRRKEIGSPSASADTNVVQWTISLQDKAWGGYTLVVTYDFQFDPHKASLTLGGIHALGVERETGSIALTSSASLQISEALRSDQLRRVDEAELAETDRSLITHSVLLAYHYSVPQYALKVDVTRFQELPVLEAVADRTQLTTVLTEEGQMLTQASFMIKNNEKQYQKFNLPSDATLWSCFVNNQPVKAEREGDNLLVPLLKQANRDQTFAVDLVYAQKTGRLEKKKTHYIELSAPRTDVQTTYAEWELYVPSTFQADKFGGNMTAPVVYRYRFIDAWRQFVHYYKSNNDQFQLFGFLGAVSFACIWMLIMAARRGFRRVFEILLVFFVIGLLAAMVIPNFVKARAKAQINTAIANLKQIDGAMETWALEKNSENFPVSLDELVGSDKYIRTMPLDPATGLQYGYAGAGKSRKTHPNAIIVYTPNNTYGTRDVLLANGEIRTMQEAEFQSALSSGASQVAARPQSQQSQAGDFQQRLLSSGIRSDAPAPTTFLNPNGEVAVVNGLVQGPGARGGFAGGVVDSAPARTDSAPVAAGIRPIRVEIPRSGSRCIFKKVLNVQDEKLVIKTRLFGLRSGFWGRGFLTAFLFLIGLGVTWIQWRRESVSTFKVSLGLAIMLLALTVHLLRVKLLGDAMIIGAPVLIMAIAIKILWLAWRRGSKKNIDTPPPSISSNGVAASGASVLLAFMFSIVSLPAQSKTIPIPASPNASIISASYRGMLNEKVAQFDVTMQLVTYSTNQAIALYGGDVSLGTFTANVTNCTLLRDGNWVRLRIPDACQVSLNLKLAVKLGGDITKRQLTFNVPPALSSTLSLVINEANAEVEFPTAVSFQRTLGAKDTRVEAIMGAGDRVEMFWTPRMKRATEVAASVFAQNTSVVSIGSGVVNTRTIMDYQVTQGEIRQIRVRLPAGQRLLRVEGEWLKLWETKPSQGGDMLTVDLIKPVAPSYKLTLELEKVLGNLPATNRVEIPHSMEVIRETGIIGLSGGEELSLSTEAFKDLQRVDQAEFPKTSQGQIISAYRFLKPGFNWVVRAETVQPQIETVVRNATRIGFEQISLTANLDYTIKKAGVFSLQLALPSDFKVTSVVEVGSREGTLTANAPAQNPVMQQQRAEPAPTEKTQELVWTEKENPRLLEIQLRERKQGSFTVRVLLNKRHSETPKTLAISGVHPLAVQKLTGFVTVAADTGLQAKTASFDGLMEVPAASVAESRGGLAFKHISSEPVPAQLPWKLQVTTETVESWVRAEVANWLTFSETLMSGRTIINYDIQNAPVKEFRFRLPVTYTNVEITGLNIRRKDHSGGDWRIELQNKVIGAYNVAVTWESTWSMTNQAGTFMFTGISTDSKTVERETGLVLINARPPLQVREQTASAELVRTDARELPAWAGIANNDTVLAYRYLRPGYQLTLAARRFDSAEVLQALVDSARLSTVVADDGQAMTEFSLVIRNNGRQHLEMELPKGAQVWSAFVAGQAVRPSIRAQRLLLPLERNVIDDAPIAVDITYVTTNLFPAKKGRVGFVTPALDVPLKNARWELYLPPDYKYDRFEGTMSRAEVEDATLVESFSQVDYSRVEDEKKVAQQIWISSNVGKVKSELAKGNIKNLAQTFNQVRQADDNNRDVKALEQTFRRSQGSNLLRAQQKLAVDNYRNANNDILDFQGQQGPVTPMNAWQNDSQVAEQQWSKVEKAQEVTVSKVRPLRVTLPIRGQKLVFNQALQTEIGKPMTVEFYAASNLGVRWFTWFVGVFGGFIGLWLLVVFARAGKR